MVKKAKNPLGDLVAYRKSLGENQTEFWTRFGLTQSGGSRYESGRSVPLPVAMLLVAHAEGLLGDEDLEKIKAKALA